MSVAVQQTLAAKPGRSSLVEVLSVVLLFIPVCVLGMVGEVLAGAFLFAAAMALALAWRKPHFALIAMVVVTFFINAVAIQLGPFRLHVADAFFFVVWLIFLSKIKLRRGFFSDPITMACALLFALGLLGAIIGVFRGNDFVLIPSELRPFAYYLLVIPFVQFLSGPQARKEVLLYLVIGAIVGMLWGFARAVLEPELTGITYQFGPISYGRLVWPLLPTFLPMHFALITFVLRSSKGVRGRTFMTGCLLLSLLGLFVSLTRGALVGAVVGPFTVAAFFKGDVLSRRQLIAGSLLFLAMMVAADFASGHAFSQRLLEAPDEDINILQRVYEIKQVLTKIEEHPVVGNGLGALHTLDLPLEQPKGSQYWINPSYSHNAYLYVWFKLGVFGLAALLLLVFLVLRKCYRAYRLSDDPFDRVLAPLVFCSIAATLVVSLTSPLFIDENEIPLIAALIAVAVTLRLRSRQLPVSTLSNITASTTSA